MRFLFGSIMALSCLMISCGHSSGKTDASSDHPQEVNRLYADLKKIYIDYTDSVKLAVDSIALKRIMDEFEEQVYNIYKRYPPNLDKELSQGQNDTLWLLANEYIKARDVSVRPEAPIVITDSLSCDTVEHLH